jgi:tRNA(Ile)-lysidine synthase
MNKIILAVNKLYAQLNGSKKIWVAYSGGVDSHVLLHALALQKPELCQLHAIHIHHGLQQQADAWQEHCAEQARRLNVSLEIQHVDARPARGKSPEATAREARYSAFAQLINSEDVLLTAHNQNDQAETVFLQLLRGAGVKGLAAMPKSIPFYSGTLYRPLLDVSRAAILEYATEYQLQWIEDPSNENTHFDRNFLRQKILPLLAERWPSFAQTVSRSADHCAEASALLENLAQQDFNEVRANQNEIVAIDKLLMLSRSRQCNVLRHWIAQQKLPVPSTSHLDCLLRDVVHAAKDKTPLIHWPGAEIRRYQNFLFAMEPIPDFDTTIEIDWDRSAPLQLPADLGTLNIDDPRLLMNGGTLSIFPKPLRLRFRRGGETMRLAGRPGNHELKKLFQEWAVLPWRRDRVPLIYANKELVLVLLSSQDILNTPK